MQLALTERSKKIGLVAFTIAAAAGIGFVMQSGSPLEASAVQSPAPKVIAASLDVEAFDLKAPPESLYQAEAVLPTLPVVLTVAADAPIAELPTEESVPLLGCDVHVHAVPAVAAMANLAVTASCFPDARVTVEHAGMIFSEVLDASGHIEISVPVLEALAEFEVTLPDGSVHAAFVEIPSLQFYDRVALQWMGESGLQIHAREFGANYGEEGHVWFGNERDLMAVIGGQGGFLLRLGDGQSEISQMADVYTFPSASAVDDGNVALTVEAEVSGANCGRQISAKTIQVSGGLRPETHAIELEIPDCAATGDFLLLKNLLQDLKIAQK